MNYVIIENDSLSLRRIKAMCERLRPEWHLAFTSSTVEEACRLFELNPDIGLALCDIELDDGLSLSIFRKIPAEFPVIFITAFDEYTLDAFKLNSIDYLLKPINKEELRNAFAKYELLFNGNKTTKDEDDSLIKKIIKEIKKENNYKTHFLIPVKGDKFIPLEVESIMLIYISEGVVKAVDNDNNQYAFSQTLDELTEMLNPKLFFRANRQFLVSKKAIRDVSIWFNGRLVLNLKNKALVDERIIVSKARAADFKEWF